MRVHSLRLKGFRGIRDGMGRDVLELDFERLASGAALVAIALDRTEHPEQAEDSIESQWATRASSGAFYDTMVAMGLATFATSVLDTASLPLWLFVLLGLADMATRLVLLQRREG